MYDNKPLSKLGCEKQAGFTLVETLVAVMILGLGLMATYSVINANLNSASLVRENYIATGLAQEGIEVIRNLRDTEWLTGVAFGTIITDGAWSVQYDSGALGNQAGEYLKKD